MISKFSDITQTSLKIKLIVLYNTWIKHIKVAATAIQETLLSSTQQIPAEYLKVADTLPIQSVVKEEK